MKINNTSIVHVKIRKASLQLELLSDMKLITNFDDDFDQIRFVNKFGYITIDYKKNACYTLGIHLNDIELQLVKDIILYCNWLEMGEKMKEIINKGGK